MPNPPKIEIETLAVNIPGNSKTLTKYYGRCIVRIGEVRVFEDKTAAFTFGQLFDAAKPGQSANDLLKSWAGNIARRYLWQLANELNGMDLSFRED